MAGVGINIGDCLGAISTRLTAAAAIAQGAVACAKAGSEGEAMRIAMDLDEVLHEVQTLHGAMALLGRMRRGEDCGID